MTKDQKLEAIKAKCVEVNPAIKTTYHETRGNNLRCSKCGKPAVMGSKCEKGDTRPIHLTDLLHAYSWLSKGILMGVNQSGYFMFSDSCTPLKGEYKFIMADHAIIGIRDATKNAKWNLLKDDLREQSDETIDFIYSLLK